MKNLLERKGYSNPDSTYSIQALQRAMRKQQAGASVEKRKYSSNPKIGVKHLSEVCEGTLTRRRRRRGEDTI